MANPLPAYGQGMDEGENPFAAPGETYDDPVITAGQPVPEPVAVAAPAAAATSAQAKPARVYTENDGCFSRNNPWEKIDTIMSPEPAKWYKRIMYLVCLTIIMVFVSLVNCMEIVQWFSLSQIFAVIFPMCGLVVHMLFFACLVVGCMVLNVIGFIGGAIKGCVVPALIVNLIMLVLNSLTLYAIFQCDSTVREKLAGCYNACKCWGNNPPPAAAAGAPYEDEEQV